MPVLTILNPEIRKMTHIRYGLYDLLFYLCPIVLLFTNWQIMEVGRFVYLFLMMLLSASLIQKQKLAGNPVVLGLGLLGCYSMATSFLSYYLIISLLKGISLLLLAGFLLFLPPAIQRLHPGIGAKEYMLRMYLYFAIIVVISNAVYYFINPSSSNDINGLYSGTSFLGGRFRGWFLNPNSVGAMYGIFFLPILWSEIGKHQMGPARLGLMVTFLIAVIELLASQSRAGILAGVAGLSILIIGQKKWGPGAMMIGMVGLLGLAIYVNNPENNLIRRFIYRNEVTLEGSARLPVWTETWNRFEARPFFGSGLGVANTASDMESREGIVFSSRGYTIEKGNSYLGALEELGLVGVAILIWTLFVPILGACWRGLNSVNLPKDKSNLMLIAIVAAGLVNTMFEAWLLSVGSILGFSFWIFAGLLVNTESDISRK
jgi:O-antigen ligase